ncbi:kti12, chromatin associated [Chytriomyces hyalinus]|nr:kti12, chromatin associated [Chytriomyces hyalinus]
MPLIILCGLPCSGKTTRATSIARALESEIAVFNAQTKKNPFDPNVIIINEESLNADRKLAYKDANSEKIHRANLLSGVERLLTRDTFVILDSLNYIKGFRYQLHCVAKGLGTSQHTVYCVATNDNARTWNTLASHYPSDVFDSLLGRLEEPDARNRWDSPLLQLMPDDELPPSFVHNMVHASVQQAPSQSIALKPLAETNYLHEMDLTLKAISDAVLEASRGGFMSGGELKVPGTDVKVLVPSKGVSVSEMGRLRRLYATNLNRLTIKIERNKIADGFVEYINQNLR